MSVSSRGRRRKRPQRLIKELENWEEEDSRLEQYGDNDEGMESEPEQNELESEESDEDIQPEEEEMESEPEGRWNVMITWYCQSRWWIVVIFNNQHPQARLHLQSLHHKEGILSRHKVQLFEQEPD